MLIVTNDLLAQAPPPGVEVGARRSRNGRMDGWDESQSLAALIKVSDLPLPRVWRSAWRLAIASTSLAAARSDRFRR